jgi:uncharacterized Zn finger protein
MAEDVTEKARRLLATDCVLVMSADESRVVARVRGDSGIHDVEWDHGTWSCTCPAWGRCSHQRAVALCTMNPVGRLVSTAP